MKVYKWKKIRSESDYNGKRIKIRKDFFKLPNGDETDFTVLERGEIVAILPITSRNEIVVVEQYRPAVNKITIDIPGGGVNSKESPLEAAKRELREETGITAGKIFKLGIFYPDSGRSEQIRHIYAATNLKFDKQVLDEGEFINIKKIPYEKLKNMILKKDIKEITLVLSFLLYENISKLNITKNNPKNK